MKTKKGNLATNPQATPSNQKTSKNQSKKRGKRGFSLVELVTIVAMMAVLMAILVPSLLPYVERTRAQRDDLAMNEVTNAVLLAMTDPDAYDELAEASLPENVSCYIDTQYESEHSELIMQQSVRTGAYHQYIFDDQARLLDATKYFAAGNMHGVTITFKPIKNMNKTKYILADGVINQFVSNKAQTLSEFPYLYSYVRQAVGEELELTSHTYRNSEYTIFIKIGTTGARQAEAQDAIMAYGQFSGTNLPTSEIRYYNAYGRAVSNPEIGTEDGYIPDSPENPDPANPINDDIPVISNGREQVFDKANPSNLIFTSTAPFNEFQTIKIDGATVGSGNYAVSEGSTIVTLFASYISTLPNGTHSFAIVSNGGIAGTTFTVIDSSDVAVVCNHSLTKVTGNMDATCTMSGYTGDTYCVDCNELIANGNYVAPTGHKEGEKVKENNVEPTCSSKGSYSMATYCESCGVELNREHFTVIETTHEMATRNENIVDATCSTIGSYEVVAYCRFCNVEINREYKTIATTEHIEANKTENVIASTCYSAGSYDLVTYCSVCNSELDRVNKPTQKANHTQATRVENEIQSTCSVNGSYDTVVYCEVCGYEINRTKHTVALLDHTQATKTDNVVMATCTVDGSYDTVTYCKVCDVEIDRKTTVVTKAGHIEATETENNILATCSNEGSYDIIVYCTVCNEELNRTTKSVPKLSHTTATKKENEIAATCSKAGSYDAVTYCKICNVEISRVTNSVAKLAHTNATKTEVNVAPTCTKDGSNYIITYCTVCKAEISRTTQTVAKTGHVNTVTKNVTEIYSGDVYCSTCNTLISTGTYGVQKKTSLNDYSWLEIQYLAQSGAALSNYNISMGDIKTYEGKSYVLVDDSRDGYYGGLVFLYASNVIATMDTEQTTSTRYHNSDMRAFLDEMYNDLPTELQNVIKTVNVRSGVAYSEDVVSFDAKLFLPSVREIGFEYVNEDDPTNRRETCYDLECSTLTEYSYSKAVFDYFRIGGVDADNRREAIGKMCSALVYPRWWLRTPDLGNYSGFYYIDDWGDLELQKSTTSNTLVIPALVIG